MLIDFRDVYWTPEGRWAVEVALSVIAAGGAYFTGLPLWRGVVVELTRAGDPHWHDAAGEQHGRGSGQSTADH